MPIQIKSKLIAILLLLSFGCSTPNKERKIEGANDDWNEIMTEQNTVK